MGIPLGGEVDVRAGAEQAIDELMTRARALHVLLCRVQRRDHIIRIHVHAVSDELQRKLRVIVYDRFDERRR